jgi:hypothetical protein
MSVALGAHPPLANCGRANAPGGCGVRVGSEHDDFGRLKASFSKSGKGDKPGQAASDDRTYFRHRYLTEPARRPWTKYRWKAKKTMRGITSETKVAGAMISMFAPNCAS